MAKPKTKKREGAGDARQPARKAASKTGDIARYSAPTRCARSSADSRCSGPNPRSELELVNPFTLLVAVVLSAQATDAGVNKATRGLFAVADTPREDGWRSARRGSATISAPSGCGATRRRTSSRCRRLWSRIMAARCRTTAPRWRRCRASGARPPTSSSTSPSASRRWPSTPISSASPTASGLAPGKTPEEVEAKHLYGSSRETISTTPITG